MVGHVGKHRLIYTCSRFGATLASGVIARLLFGVGP